MTESGWINEEKQDKPINFDLLIKETKEMEERDRQERLKRAKAEEEAPAVESFEEILMDTDFSEIYEFTERLQERLEKFYGLALRVEVIIRRVDKL